jgi:hypothetical protein
MEVCASDSARGGRYGPTNHNERQQQNDGPLQRGGPRINMWQNHANETGDFRSHGSCSAGHTHGTSDQRFVRRQWSHVRSRSTSIHLPVPVFLSHHLQLSSQARNLPADAVSCVSYARLKTNMSEDEYVGRCPTLVGADESVGQRLDCTWLAGRETACIWPLGWLRLAGSRNGLQLASWVWALRSRH